MVARLSGLSPSCVIADVCKAHGVWLDPRELEQMDAQRRLRAGQRAARGMLEREDEDPTSQGGALDSLPQALGRSLC